MTTTLSTPERPAPAAVEEARGRRRGRAPTSKRLVVCERDPECPWSLITDFGYPARAAEARERHYASRHTTLMPSLGGGPAVTGMPNHKASEEVRAAELDRTAEQAPRGHGVCPMCALDIFPGHGHLRETDDGVVVITRPSTIRWAA